MKSQASIQLVERVFHILRLHAGDKGQWKTEGVMSREEPCKWGFFDGEPLIANRENHQLLQISQVNKDQAQDWNKMTEPDYG